MELFIPPASTKSPLRVVTCLGLSLLLHAGVIGIIDYFQLLTPDEEPMTVVKVDLVEIQHLSAPKTNSQTPSTDGQIPAMKTVPRSKRSPVHAPLQQRPSFVDLSKRGRPPEVSSGIQSIPLRMPKTHQTKRPPLFDQTAQSALRAKDLFKVIPHATFHKLSRPRLLESQNAHQGNRMAEVSDRVLPVQRQEVIDRLFGEGHQSMPSRQSRAKSIHTATAMDSTRAGNTKKTPLTDDIAQNSLKANELYKIIPPSGTPSNSGRSSRRLAASTHLRPRNLGTKIPSVAASIHPKAVKAGRVVESRQFNSSQRLLSMNMPHGDGEIGKRRAMLAQSQPPVYPSVAREQGWEGTVVLRVRLYKDGTPEHVAVHKTSGHDVLDQAAIKAIYKWSFVTARDGNIPISSLVDVPVRFDLTKG